VLLGDSMSMAEGVEFEEIYLKQFEKLANNNCPNDNIESINAAIRGYGNDQEVILYERIGHRFSPDLVILAFYEGNDFKDNRIGGIFKLVDGKLIKTLPSNQNSLKFKYYSKQIKIQNLPGYPFLVGNFHLVNFLRSHSVKLLTKSTIGCDNETKKQENINTSDWSLTSKILERWELACFRNGSIPLILFIPTFENIVEVKKKTVRDDLRIDEKLKRFTNRRRILWINPVETFSETADPKGLYLKDGHLSPTGHKVLAKEIFQFLIKSGMICRTI